MNTLPIAGEMFLVEWRNVYLRNHTGLLFTYIPYFLGYKTDFFSFQNNSKDLDPSYKTDLDL